MYCVNKERIKCQKSTTTVVYGPTSFKVGRVERCTPMEYISTYFLYMFLVFCILYFISLGMHLLEITNLF